MSTANGLAFDRLCVLHALERPVSEFRFASSRRWRFDWAWPAPMVALEVDGGVFVGGRHSQGAGAMRDMEKLNEAAILGWCVLRCVPRTLGDDATIDLIRRALSRRTDAH